MNKVLRNIVLIGMAALASCQDFLEPASQSEYVPQLVESLDELLLGEAYVGPYDPQDGSFYTVLGLFDDDVAIRQGWNASAEYEGQVNDIRLAYSWSSDMKDVFSGYNTYGQVYEKILGCNAVLDYVDDVQGSEDEKNNVKAQALALRGYYYWFLVNLYGQPYSYNKDALGVPLQLTSELDESGKPRNTVGEVSDQILKDLQEAERLFASLPESMQVLRNNRVNLPFTQLMLSRVCLYMENWEQALAYANLVIDNNNFGILDLNSLPLPDMYGNPAYMDYYTYDNPEVIFLFGNWYDVLSLTMMSYVNYGEETPGGMINWTKYNLPVVSESLINAYGTDGTDLRRRHYLIPDEYNATPYYQPCSKFRVDNGFRLQPASTSGNWGVAFKVTEAYLNGAEAAAMLFKNGAGANYQTEAQALLDDLRVNRVVNGSFENVSIVDPDELVAFVRDERRRELCFENHRWFDLRRYGMEPLTHIWYDESNNASEFVLEKNAPGFTLQIPNEAFEHNSAMVQNEI